MIAGRPGHLQDDHSFGARVLANDLRGQSHHTEGAAQEGRLAGHVVLDLLEKSSPAFMSKESPCFWKMEPLEVLRPPLAWKIGHVAPQVM